MDPHEDLQVGALFGWVAGPMLEEVAKYKETLKKYPNPPASDVTKFQGETTSSEPQGLVWISMG
jgi:arylsulfatase